MSWKVGDELRKLVDLPLENCRNDDRATLVLAAAAASPTAGENFHAPHRLAILPSERLGLVALTLHDGALRRHA